MLKNKKSHLLVCATTVLFCALGFFIYQYYLNSIKVNSEISLDDTPINRLEMAPVSYASMLEEAQKMVVSVYTSDVTRILNNQYGTGREEWLRRYHNLPSRNARIEERKIQQGVGSGVILSPDGYIITNDHVIRNKQGGVADEVLVRLSNNREYKASVVGRDPRSDLAVLKVAAVDLPHATIADSEKVLVGDVVFAIGNPMGVGLTVTSGIISATGRSIGIYGENGLENFMQTDASINPGNSGGALVDHKGRLVGINSAILSKSGGNIGIGFAIPSELFVAISSELIKHGKMLRGVMGVHIAPLNAEIKDKLKISDGILIVDVLDGYGAQKAGLQRGDVITIIDGQPIKSMQNLNVAIASKAVNSVLSVTVVRDADTLQASVRLR